MVNKVFVYNFPFKSWKQIIVPCDLIIVKLIDDEFCEKVDHTQHFLYTVELKRSWGTECKLRKGGLPGFGPNANGK